MADLYTDAKLRQAENATAELGRQLPFMWASIRAASCYVQQLDDLVVRADVWGASYSNAQAVLDGATGRLELWVDVVTPELASWTQDVRGRIYQLLRRVQRHVGRFEWNEAQGRLFLAGELVYKISELVEVNL